MVAIFYTPDKHIKGKYDTLNADLELVRASIGVLRNKFNEILLLLRSPEDRSFPNSWCHAGGKIDGFETPEQAVIREYKEETGLKVQIAEKAFVGLVADKKLAKIFEIHCFVVELVDKATANIELSDEHISFQWISPNCVDPKDLAGPINRSLTRYMQVK